MESAHSGALLAPRNGLGLMADACVKVRANHNPLPGPLSRPYGHCATGMTLAPEKQADYRRSAEEQQGVSNRAQVTVPIVVRALFLQLRPLSLKR